MNETVKCINGRLKVGDFVISTPDDDFGCLVGMVLSIALLNTPEHDTDNETDDVHVNFDVASYSDRRISEIEQAFSELYREPRQYKDLPLGEVIMEAKCLIRITDIGEIGLKYLLSSEALASNYCYRELRRVMLGTVTKKEAANFPSEEINSDMCPAAKLKYRKRAVPKMTYPLEGIRTHRLRSVLDKALYDYADRVSGIDLYDLLSDTLEMTDTEIGQAGFDLQEYYTEAPNSCSENCNK